jgi:hypothetical protein
MMPTVLDCAPRCRGPAHADRATEWDRFNQRTLAIDRQAGQDAARGEPVVPSVPRKTKETLRPLTLAFTPTTTASTRYAGQVSEPESLPA